MLYTPGKLPVRTRLPLAAWAVAGVVTIISLMSSLWQAHHPIDHGMPSAEQLDALIRPYVAPSVS